MIDILQDLAIMALAIANLYNSRAILWINRTLKSTVHSHGRLAVGEERRRW